MRVLLEVLGVLVFGAILITGVFALLAHLFGPKITVDDLRPRSKSKPKPKTPRSSNQ